MSDSCVSSDTTSAFVFRNTDLKLVSFCPSTLDPVPLEVGLRQQLGRGEHFLSGEQIVIDFSGLPETPSAVEVSALIGLLRQYQLQAVAAQSGNTAQSAAAKEAGLILLSNESLSAQASQQKALAARSPTLIVSKAVRTGQQVYARGGDLVVLGLVSAGAEVIADGNIHVYAPLRGRALAGAQGDHAARIYTTCMEAELVSIAGIYRTLDENLPESIKAKPAQVWLEQDKLVIEALQDIN